MTKPPEPGRDARTGTGHWGQALRERQPQAAAEAAGETICADPVEAVVTRTIGISLAIVRTCPLSNPWKKKNWEARKGTGICNRNQKKKKKKGGRGEKERKKEVGKNPQSCPNPPPAIASWTLTHIHKAGRAMRDCAQSWREAVTTEMVGRAR